MAFMIVAETCTLCGACRFECPSAAIADRGDTYVIDPGCCTECKGAFEDQQCASVCPVPDTCVKVPERSHAAHERRWS